MHFRNVFAYEFYVVLNGHSSFTSIFVFSVEASILVILDHFNNF